MLPSLAFRVSILDYFRREPLVSRVPCPSVPPVSEMSAQKRQRTAKAAPSKKRPKTAKRSKRRPRSSTPAKGRPAPSGPERLQKVLAAAGVGSRRQCEELILEGRIEVDHKVVTELGTKVDPASQQIRVDGVTLTQPKMVYYAVNKPPGMVCTNRDPSGRPRVIDLVPNAKQRLFTVGRLDLNSEGLIILTNDGEVGQPPDSPPIRSPEDVSGSGGRPSRP